MWEVLVRDFKSWRKVRSVWPDAGIKTMPFFILMAPKVSKVAFYSKVTYFKIAQKVSKYLGHFNEKICCYNFRTSPNLVTLGPILFLGKLAVQSRVRILRWGGGKGNVREVPKVFSHVVVVVVCAFITDVVSREEKREGEREREREREREWRQSLPWNKHSDGWKRTANTSKNKSSIQFNSLELSGST